MHNAWNFRRVCTEQNPLSFLLLTFSFWSIQKGLHRTEPFVVSSLNFLVLVQVFLLWEKTKSSSAGLFRLFESLSDPMEGFPFAFPLEFTLPLHIRLVSDVFMDDIPGCSFWHLLVFGNWLLGLSVIVIKGLLNFLDRFRGSDAFYVLILGTRFHLLSLTP